MLALRSPCRRSPLAPASVPAPPARGPPGPAAWLGLPLPDVGSDSQRVTLPRGRFLSWLRATGVSPAAGNRLVLPAPFAQVGARQVMCHQGWDAPPRPCLPWALGDPSWLMGFLPAGRRAPVRHGEQRVPAGSHPPPRALLWLIPRRKGQRRQGRTLRQNPPTPPASVHSAVVQFE